MINLHKLKDRLWLDDEVREEPRVILDPHRRDPIDVNPEDGEIVALRAKVEAGATSKYLIQEGLLYYLSGRRRMLGLRWLSPDD